MLVLKSKLMMMTYLFRSIQDAIDEVAIKQVAHEACLDEVLNYGSD